MLVPFIVRVNKVQIQTLGSFYAGIPCCGYSLIILRNINCVRRIFLSYLATVNVTVICATVIDQYNLRVFKDSILIYQTIYSSRGCKGV
jgi:hypothetical protein